MLFPGRGRSEGSSRNLQLLEQRLPAAGSQPPPSYHSCSGLSKTIPFYHLGFSQPHRPRLRGCWGGKGFNPCLMASCGSSTLRHSGPEISGVFKHLALAQFWNFLCGDNLGQVALPTSAEIPSMGEWGTGKKKIKGARRVKGPGGPQHRAPLEFMQCCPPTMGSGKVWEEPGPSE